MEIVASLAMTLNFNPYDIGDVTYLDFEMQNEILDRKFRAREKQMEKSANMQL